MELNFLQNIFFSCIPRRVIYFPLLLIDNQSPTFFDVMGNFTKFKQIVHKILYQYLQSNKHCFMIEFIDSICAGKKFNLKSDYMRAQRGFSAQFHLETKCWTQIMFF